MSNDIALQVVTAVFQYWFPFIILLAVLTWVRVAIFD